ncbi:MAG: GNAT family N-acetyltransferase [Treponema sp.]|nr:GNAT family N-acetyltransferase [Treponema sp.]
MEIRLATAKDAPQLFCLNEQFNGAGVATLEGIRGSLAGGHQEVVFVADLGGVLAGFVCVQLKKSFCYSSLAAEITEVFVRQDFRRRGIASRMIEAAERHCRRNYPLGEFTLLVGKSNLAAYALYKSLGFCDDGRRHLAKGRWPAFPPA